MITYLAEPMDFAHGVDRDEANQLARGLTAIGFSVYRPAMAWLGPATRPDHVTADVVRTNREILDGANLVVAVLPGSVRSIGVPMEIAWATEQEIPVILLTDVTGSAMLDGNPMIIRVATVEDALAAAKRVVVDGSSVTTIEPPRPTTIDDPRGLLVRLTHNKAWPPTRAHDDDAGFDLVSTVDTRIEPGQFAFVPCGIEIALPPDTFGWVVARSSTMPRWGLVVTPGVIDPGFRGEMGVPAYRVPGWPWSESDHQIESAGYTVPAGTRLAQLVPLPNIARTFGPVLGLDELPTPGDGRGRNGFGSTGANGVPVPTASGDDAA